MNMQMFPILPIFLIKSYLFTYNTLFISFLLLAFNHTQAATFSNITKLWSHSSGSEIHTCVIQNSGESCWGNNDDGQLADNTTTEYHTPVPVDSNDSLIEIALGENHTCGLELDGDVDCWGDDSFGQVGVNVSNAIAIGAGANHSCALIADGTMKCWGSNSNGQLGDGTTTDSTSAISVSGLSDVTAIGIGGHHTCAVVSGGNVKCWGKNTNGQLGDTTTTDSSSAITVSGLSNVDKLALGQSHSCALLNDDTVKCWGLNTDGQLGDASNTQSSSPVTVSGLSSAIKITAGYTHSCALLADGTIQCWGNNTYGQLGDGSNIATNTPISISSLSSITDIAASGHHTCALLVNTSAKCWGYNHKGQLSDYTTTDRNTPTTVIEVWPGIVIEFEGDSVYSGIYGYSYLNSPNDFDDVEVDAFLDKTFTITNGGEVDLLLQGTPIVDLEEYDSSDDCSHFSIQTQPSLTTIPNDGTSTDLIIRYSPIDQVVEYCVVYIETNDRYETPYRFRIRGEGDKQSQIITFNNLSDKTYGNADFAVSASSDSSLDIEYNTSGNCSNSGATITLTGAGSCTVTASQYGDDDYYAATDVSRSFSIVKANQTISVFDPIDSALSDSTASLSATTSSGLTASFSSDTPSVCSVSGSTVNYLTSGTCTLVASQSGDSDYNAAPNVSSGVDVGKANTTVTITQVVYSPSGIGQATTFFFAIGSDLGSNMTGEVLIEDSTDSFQCTVTLAEEDNGIGSCEITFTAKGNYQMSASYLGDNSYNPGYSNEIIQHQVDRILINYTTSNTVLPEESEESDLYYIQLATFPAAPVNITIEPDAQLSVNGQGAGVPLTLQIADTQAVALSVLPIDDTLLEGNHQGIITHSSSSPDPNYDDDVREVIFPILDNDAGIIIEQTDFSTQVIEGSDSDRYLISLSLQPTSDVTIEPVVDGAQISVYPNSATFTRLNWSKPQYFRVSAINDTLEESTHSAEISHTITTLDQTYLDPEWVVDDITGHTVNVSIIDDDGNAAPSAPSGLSANISPDNQIVFGWLDNSDNETQFILQQTIAELPPNVSGYAFDTTGIECGVTQQFVLFASNALGESEQTEVNLTLPCPTVSAPTQVTANVSNSNTVQLLWTDNNANEVGYQISRNGQLLTNTAPDTQQYSDTGLLCGAVYQYAIRAIDSSLQLSPATDTQVILACPDASTDEQGDSNNDSNQTTDDTDGDSGENNTDSNQSNGNNTQETDTSPFAGTPAELLPPPPSVVLSNGESISQAANIAGQTVQDLTIGQGGSVSNGTLAGNTSSEGLISNMTIAEGATLSGGSISGTNINHGTIRDATITLYSEVTGGLFEGNIINRGSLNNVSLAEGCTVTGGELGGTIQSQGTIFDVDLNPSARVIGGKMGGEIHGTADAPAYLGAVEILAGATLSHVRISPTTILPDDVTLGEGVIFPSSYKHPNFVDFGIDETRLNSIDAETFQGVESAALSLFEPNHLQQLPLEIFAAFEAEDISYLQAAAVSAMTFEQFEQLPLEALSGLTADNVDALNSDVLSAMSLEQLNAIQPDAIKQAKQPAKIFTQLSRDNINPAQLKDYLPQGWQIDEATGKITTPTGTKLTYKNLGLQNIPSPKQAGFPDIADLSTSFSLGGSGGNSAQQDLNIGLQQSLSLGDVDLSQFIFTQNENGVLNIVGEGDYAGIIFAFLPGVDGIEQAPLDVPVGLSQDEGGFFTMITPEQQQFFLTPSSNNPVGLIQVISDAPVDTESAGFKGNACDFDPVAKFNEAGDVLLTISKDKARRRTRGFETDVHMVAMFDAFVEPAPSEFCEGEDCDWLEMPDNLQQGMHFPDNLRALQQAYVVYPDGSSQPIYPTALYPNKLQTLLEQIEGVEKVLYLSDGSFKINYFEQTVLLYPTFDTVTTPLLNPNAEVQPSIELLKNGQLSYSVQDCSHLVTTSLTIEFTQ
ncbi:Ig-like domain repeat protein [Candidatus Albibeggiatoa sp. nov. BB20]|uniref:RCC1 domain-containing protein n=1 Tax=Candidatus Albibeggiatoa sp. nov. BB20 TaxID=3162723 RepID=UPI0033655016